MSKFKFIDLFAGIGGFHVAMHELGGECVFASEIDSSARKTYEANFRHINPSLFESGLFNADIREINPSDLPDFDVLCAGFPCQPFSQAGQKKGFNDSSKSERGNLFFKIAEILEAKRPKAFFLENVRGIVNHDGGRTFEVIRSILEDDLGYSFNWKVLKASDYGLPQLRPRAMMIGFLKDKQPSTFLFPAPIPLKFNMSHVWGGVCSREVGFTLRVGGRGSDISDRRNWDSYLVDGTVKKIMPKQARVMQGFPEDFVFPVASTQAMKQLGNSVAVDVIRACGQALIDYLESLGQLEDEEMDGKMNKGEWTEIYCFLKLLSDKKIALADKNLNVRADAACLHVTKVTTMNIKDSCYLVDNDSVLVVNSEDKSENKVRVSDFINSNVLIELRDQIKNGQATFHIPDFLLIQKKLGISIVKGGTSSQKSDILLDVHNDDFSKVDEGFGIKSYLGSKPTLLNASGNTNFVFEVVGLKGQLDFVSIVNSIETKTKVKDRISKVLELGGGFIFKRVEMESMQYNLEMVDSLMPDLIAKMLLEFYLNRTNSVAINLKNIIDQGFSGDLMSGQVKIKRLLISILLGFFAGKKWDGCLVSNGIIVVKEDGHQVGFHIVDLKSLEDYLFDSIKFDTPSTTRHRYGQLIQEIDGKFYFKLNMQLRF